MRHEAILFDNDGTLVDTPKIYEAADIEYFARYGVHLKREDFDRMYTEGWHIDKEWYALAKIFEEEHVKRVDAERAGRFAEVMKNVDLYPDAQAILPHIATLRKTAIVTATTRACFDVMHAQTRIREIISTIITREDVKLHKPHPDGIFLATAQLEVDPANCLYVGDLPSDMLTARNAGMKGCLIRRAHTPDAALQLADMVLESLEELKDLL